MRILLIGSSGQLASDLLPILRSQHEVLPIDVDEMRVEVADEVEGAVDARRPDLLLNCSAFNRVDDAEDNVAGAFAVNTFGPRNLAVAARRHDIPLVHYSTDYVFQDGTAPHPETDLPNPQSVYGAVSYTHLTLPTICSV